MDAWHGSFEKGNFFLPFLFHAKSDAWYEDMRLLVGRHTFQKKQMKKYYCHDFLISCVCIPLRVAADCQLEFHYKRI